MESGLGSTFDPTRTVIRSGHPRFNTGIALIDVYELMPGTGLFGDRPLLRRPDRRRALRGELARHLGRGGGTLPRRQRDRELCAADPSEAIVPPS